MARNMGMRRLQGRDDVEVDSTQRTLTAEGYMVAPGRISRTGVQAYTKMELGIGPSEDLIRLYRPPEEVFATESLASFDNQVITWGHPANDVTSENYRELTIGDTRAPEQDDIYVRAQLTVRDYYAIYGVIDGVVQLSCGYKFDLDETAGFTPEGEAYDAVMRNIRGNHVAIVYAARCGAGCAIEDAAHRTAHDAAVGRKPNTTERARLRVSATDCACGGRKHATAPNPGDSTMATKPIKVGSITLALEGTTADVVDAFVSDAAKSSAEAKTALDAATAKLATAEAALAAEKEGRAKDAAAHATEVEGLKKQIPTAAQMTALVAERTKVVGDAKLLAADIDDAGKSVHEVRVAALTAVLAKDGTGKAIATAALGGKAPADADSAIVTIAFDAVVAAGATDARGQDFQLGLGAALVGDTGTPAAASATDGQGTVTHLRGYQRTLANLNKSPRAAT
jgi:uncharacterized protein